MNHNLLFVFLFVFQDPRFNRNVDVATGYQTKSILCMPIKSLEGQVTMLSVMFNYNNLWST